MDFLSVMDCFKNLCMIDDYIQMTENIEIPFLKERLGLSIHRILSLMYTIMQAKKEEEDKICEGIKFLYQFFVKEEYKQLEEEFLQNMWSIYCDISANGALAGISSGILLKKDKIEIEHTIQKFNCYLSGSEQSKKMAASFLKGFFKIAKDVIFVDNRLLQALDTILKETTGNLFLEILPDLRLAFTYFLPFETDKIAKQVSSFYHVSMEDVLYKQGANQIDMETASKADDFCKQKLEEWLGI